MALSYMTSPRGACHNQSDYFLVELGHTEEQLGINYFERHAQAEKAAIFHRLPRNGPARHQDWRTAYNSLVMCIFATIDPNEQVNLINAACGLNLTLDDMMAAGERAWNLKRAINNRMGLTRANDKLPKALLEPLSDGGSARFVPDVDGMLAAYYQHRGWDMETGRPSREKMSALGMDDIAKDLWG